MFEFANPQLLYLLLCFIPLIAIMYYLYRIWRLQKLKTFGQLSIIAKLMPDYSKYKHGIKLTFELTIIALMIVLLARPLAGKKEEVESTSSGIEVMLALDVSNSMLGFASNDPNGISRLQRAKHILEKLVEKLDNDKVGLIVFAGDAYTQMPLTSDYLSAKMYLRELSPNIVPKQGTAIGAAINMATNSFSADSDVNKAIILLTDAENFEDNAVEMAKAAQDKDIQINVIGLGTTQGSPIPIDNSKGNYMKDKAGNPVTTRLNEEIAKEIAKAGDGIYINGNSSTVVNAVSDKLDTLGKTNFDNVKYSANAEQFSIVAWIILFLLVIDIFILERKISWLDKIKFFSKD